MNSSTLVESGGLLHKIPEQLSGYWPGWSAAGSTVMLMLAFVVIFENILAPKYSTLGKFWASQPWLANRGEWFSHLRAQFRFLKHGLSMIDEGYEKYSKHDKAFALPMFTHPPHLVLPPSQLRTLLNKPDTELDEHIPHDEATSAYYTTEDSRIKFDDFHFDVVKRELTRKLSVLTEDVHDELQYAMRHVWSNSFDEWSTIKIYSSCMSIVARAANRVFSGPELCRDADFIEHSKLYSQGVFGGSAMIRLFPEWMHPVVGRAIVYPNYRNRRICAQRAEPVIKERLANTLKKHADPSFEWEPAADALQWLIARIVVRNDPSEMTVQHICDRLLRLNMVAIHTTSMAISNVIMDIYSAPDKEQILSTLREECAGALAANGGRWTKQAVNSLLHVDSTIRETMRVSDLGSLGMHRMVVAKDGVDFGPNIHVPPGVRVAIPTHAMHHDPDIYPEPNVYKPFRFSTVRTSANDEPDARTAFQRKNCALVTVADDFLSFGHGRHSCPGRFFAAQEMKLMLAEIVMGFDIEMVDEKRPKNTLIAGVSIPSSTAEMRVRRRAQMTN